MSSGDLVQPLPFGGCNLHNPILRASQDGRIGRRYRDASAHRNWLLTLSPRAMIQAHDFLTGAKTIAPELQTFYTGEEGYFAPAANAADVIAGCDVAIIEISTPYEFAYRGLILNVNRLSEFFGEFCAATGTPKRNFEAWRTALLKQQQDKAKELGEVLKDSLEQPSWDGIDLPDLIANISCRELGVDETTELVGELRDRIGKPVGMVIHNFRFMPDGRAISWPTDFKRNSVEVAGRLGLPTLDLAPLVVEHGATLVVAEDGRHWNPTTGMPLVGSWLADFAEKLTGRTTTAARAPSTSETVAAAVKAATASRIPEYRFDSASGSYFPLRDDLMPMVLVLGDAWALGENGDPEDSIVTALPEHPEHALMFAAGPAPGEKLTGRFTSLQESQGLRRRETPCSGIADVVMSECASRFGAKPRMLFSAAGHPGAMLVSDDPSSQGFNRGSLAHSSALNLVSSAKHLAAAEGRELQVLAICFAQARNHEPSEGMSRRYWNALLKLRLHYEADLSAITGQSDPIPLLLPQHGRGGTRVAKYPSTALAQLEAADTDPLVRCIGPVYHLDPEGSADGKGWRLTSDSYRRLGRQFGRFIMDDLLGPGLQPLRAISCRLAGPRKVHLNYARDLAIDTSSVDVDALGPGLGIDFVDGPKPTARIVSVKIPHDRPRRLEIELDSEPERPGSLYIAARSSGSGAVGRTTGPRSAIRAAEPALADPRSNRPIFDWACTEVVPIA
jgi:hypothetical protein